MAPPGIRQAIALSVEPRVPLPSEMTRTYLFTVTARAQAAPDPVREVQGQWVQVAPQLEASLHPTQQTAAEEGRFRIQVTNQSLADLEVSLEVSDQTGACRFACEPRRLTVPAAGDRSAALVVRSSQPLYGKEAVHHAFYVTVQPVGAPRFAQRLQGEWVQTPRRRSLWPPFLLMVAGWILGWFLYLVLHPEVWFMWLGGPLEMIGLPWLAIEAGVWAARGLVLGLLGGLVTGVAIHWADRTFGWGRVLWVGVLWALVWAAGTAIPPLIGVPLEEMPPLFWAVKDGIVGLVGGLLTGATLREPSAIGVALGWGLGWGLGGLAGSWMFMSGLAGDLFEPPWGQLSIMIGGLGALIGGGIMFAAMARARRKG
jgi:hypothetical protein